MQLMTVSQSLDQLKASGVTFEDDQYVFKKCVTAKRVNEIIEEHEGNERNVTWALQEEFPELTLLENYAIVTHALVGKQKNMVENLNRILYQFLNEICSVDQLEAHLHEFIEEARKSSEP